MRKAEHKSPGTHNPAAPAYENLISQLTTPSLGWQVMIHYLTFKSNQYFNLLNYQLNQMTTGHSY